MKLGTYEISQRSIALVEKQLAAKGIGPFQRPADRRLHFVWGALTGHTISVQVKGNAEPKPGGGKGKLALDWWIDENTPADVLALVDLSTQRVWLMSRAEVAELAQQHSSGRHHLYMYVDSSAVLRRGNFDSDFTAYLLDRSAPRIFRAP